LFGLIIYYVVLCMLYYVVLCTPYSVIAAHQIPVLIHPTQQLTVM